MKKYFALIALLALSLPSFGWGGFGHQVVVALAQRHLTEEAKENIAKIMPYDLKQDASWMDAHRNDPGIAYTTNWHTYGANLETHEYDPSARWGKGDVIHAIDMAVYNLERKEHQTEEINLMSLRMLIHFVGDMHCPVHCGFVGFRSPVMTGYMGTKSFHAFYDSIPAIIYKGQTPDQVAEFLDTYSKGRIKKTGKGCPVSWAKECADNSCLIYEINPAQGKKEITPNPDTVDLSREMIDTQLRNAGYRLAVLLNRLFG